MLLAGKPINQKLNISWTNAEILYAHDFSNQAVRGFLESIVYVRNIREIGGRNRKIQNRGKIKFLELEANADKEEL